MPGTDTPHSEAQCFRGSTVSGGGCIIYQCREEVDGGEDRLHSHQDRFLVNKTRDYGDSYHVLSLQVLNKPKLTFLL